MDGCMEPDGRVGERRGNIYILKRISTRRGYTTILRNFKNATFFFDCFLYWVDLIKFPIQYFLLSRDKQHLTVKRILLRPFILTVPRH